MYKIQPQEFTELKRLFDQNDPNQGAQYLNSVLGNWLEDSMTREWDGQDMFHIPFEVGDGLSMTSNSYEKPKIELDEYIWRRLTEMSEQISALQKMHAEDGKHIPKIISTREQYEEMKPEMDEKERVLVHTTFDKALNVL